MPQQLCPSMLMPASCQAMSSIQHSARQRAIDSKPEIHGRVDESVQRITKSVPQPMHALLGSCVTLPTPVMLFRSRLVPLNTCTLARLVFKTFYQFQNSATLCSAGQGIRVIQDRTLRLNMFFFLATDAYPGVCGIMASSFVVRDRRCPRWRASLAQTGHRGKT